MAVPRTAERTVRNYGASGKGVLDDTASLQAALNAGGRVIFPAGRFKLTAPLTIPSTVKSIDGGGSECTVLDFSSVTAASFTAMTATGSLAAPVSLTADAAELDTVLHFTTAGFAVGDWIKVRSNDVVGSTNQQFGEYARIKSVDSGTQVTLYEPLNAAYLVASSAAVRKASLITNLGIRGIGFEGPDDNTLDIGGISLDGVLNAEVESCRFEQTHYYGVSLADTLSARVHDNHFEYLTKAGLAYGVACSWACQDVTVSGNTGRRMRHLFSAGGGAVDRQGNQRWGIGRRITVQGNVVSQAMDAGFDCHPAGEDISFIGNTVSGSDQDGIVFQATSGLVSGNTIRNAVRHGILIQPATTGTLDLQVSNNRIRWTTYQGASSSGRAIALSTVAGYGNYGELDITDNTIRGCYRGIDLSNTQSFRTSGIKIAGNKIRDSRSHGIFVQKSDDLMVGLNDVVVTQAGVSALYLSDVNGGAVSSGFFKGGATTGSSYGVRLEAGSTNIRIGGALRVTNANYGVGCSDNTVTNVVVDQVDLTGCTTPVLEGTGAGLIVGRITPPSIPSLASAAALTLPRTSDDITITGTTTITSIAVEPGVAIGSAGSAYSVNRLVRLRFSAACQVTDGSNLKLAGNFVATANSVLVLRCTGTNWEEVARSVN